MLVALASQLDLLRQQLDLLRQQQEQQRQQHEEEVRRLTARSNEQVRALEEMTHFLRSAFNARDSGELPFHGQSEDKGQGDGKGQ